MSYGRYPYGQEPYVGANVTGPTLTYNSPLNNATGVLRNAPVVLVIEDLAELDVTTLSVDFNGTPVIAAGAFQVGFNGTIVDDVTSITVSISTHPLFTDGAQTTVNISVTDQDTVTGNFSFLFWVAEASVSNTETLGPINETVDETAAFNAYLVQSHVIADTVVIEGTNTLDIAEGFVIAEGLVSNTGAFASENESLSLSEVVTASIYLVEPIDNTSIRLVFPVDLSINNIDDTGSFKVQPLGGGYPATVYEVTPEQTTIQTFTDGVLTSEGSTFTNLFSSSQAVFNASHIRDYLEVYDADGASLGYAQITSIVSSTQVRLSKSFFPGAALIWKHKSFVTSVILRTNKLTNGEYYRVTTNNLEDRFDRKFNQTVAWAAIASKPKVQSASFNVETGEVQVVFQEPMRFDQAIIDVGEYSITGPSTVTIKNARNVGPQEVVLNTIGLGVGSYTLTINATGTPKDVAGNPMDPLFNTAVFTSSVPINSRSVFTDKGPIARPPLNLQTGSGVVFQSHTTLTLMGAALDSSYVGKYLNLTGSSINGGDFVITGVLSSNQCRVSASFTLPDVSVISWLVYDPRTSQIADDPSHVTVRINGLPVTPEAVVGLLGQVVLPSTPLPTDDVKIDYSWICNPTVGIQRLNSKEFRLNSWNRNTKTNNQTQHVYRYNNTLVEPSNYVFSTTVQTGTGATITAPNTIDLTSSNVLVGFVGLTLTLSGLNQGTKFRIETVASTTQITVSPNPIFEAGSLNWSILDEQGNILSVLKQPQQRDLKYRAYERAYTAVLNDPNRLVLNVPINRIAYPPMSRTVDESFVNYQPVLLPEADFISPWTKEGTGLVSIVSNRLLVEDTTTGPFPTGKPLFWKRLIDLTFPHAFALSWQFQITATPTKEGVWTGLAVGFSNELVSLVVGFLEVSGVKKIGILKRGFGNNPEEATSWTGGVDTNGDPTNLPVDFDWSVLHSYRVFRSKDGILKVFFDGEVVEALRVTPDELPFLEELNAPFNELQGVFFGSLSRPAANSSTWDFVRYLIAPTNPLQTAPSLFANYEGNDKPEVASPPWTPIGYHGTETPLTGGFLLVDSTSATDDTTEAEVGLVGGDFKGFNRIEPLLGVKSDVIFDANVQIRTWTHGITPDAAMVAIDDGSRLFQLSFLSENAAPKHSYGGRSLPTDWTPNPWGTMGTAPVEMLGRTLRITDSSNSDGRIYYLDDLPTSSDPARVVGDEDYIFEFRCTVQSYTVDAGDFAGTNMEVYDSTRSVGVMLRDIGGVRNLTFHSEGVPLLLGDVVFEWFDGKPHTYRVTKSTLGNLVSLFVDGVFVYSMPYSDFTVSAFNPVGVITFGSSTAASLSSRSTVDWFYANAWRSNITTKKFVGIWKGSDSSTLMGYHLPLKQSGVGATVAGNALGDGLTNFLTSGVAVGDKLVIDDGTNKGTYEIASVAANSITITTVFPNQPSVVSYRIPKETDWTTAHKYRISRKPDGLSSVFLDALPDPIMQLEYNEINLPLSQLGLPSIFSGGLPSLTWGAFDPTNLSQTSWDYLRYGITRAPSERRLVQRGHVLNQRNVIASPEHIFTALSHTHTDFWSRSTGQPPKQEPDFLKDPNLVAFTLLNEGTPLVPLTQTAEVRGVTTTTQFISSLNSPEDVLNTDPDFVLNDARLRRIVGYADDVLYNSLDIIERTTGDVDLVSPFCDDCPGPQFGPLEYKNHVCLTYTGDVLPELDSSASTPWDLVSDAPGNVSRSTFMSVLTYGTTGPAKTVYRNQTPLPDSIGLEIEVKFRLKVLQDTTLGLGDSQIRLGFSSSSGMTPALAFVTTPLGERYVLVVDLNNQNILGGIPFDWYDGNYHTYMLTRKPNSATLQVSVAP